MIYFTTIILYDVVQKKFQQRHLATVAAVKGTVAGSTTSSTTSSTKTTGSGDLPVPPVRRIVGAIAPVQPQPPQRRPAGSGSGGDSVVQVDVKGKVSYKLNILFFAYIIIIKNNKLCSYYEC